jgi:hypothetical protein
MRLADARLAEIAASAASFKKARLTNVIGNANVSALYKKKKFCEGKGQQQGRNKHSTDELDKRRREALQQLCKGEPDKGACMWSRARQRRSTAECANKRGTLNGCAVEEERDQKWPLLPTLLSNQIMWQPWRLLTSSILLQLRQT